MSTFHNLLTKHACLRHVLHIGAYVLALLFHMGATTLTTLFCVYRCNFDLMLTYEAGSLVWAILLCVLLNGLSIFKATKVQLCISWDIYKPMIFISMVSAALSIPMLLHDSIASHVCQSVMYQMVLCIGIGFSEEVLFRGVLFHGCLKIFSTHKHKLFLSCIVVSLVFGAFHIPWNQIDPSDTIQLAQIIGKIVQTGLCSILLCLVVYKTKSIVGASLLHALDDFIVMIIPFGILGQPVSTDYVVKGTDGVSLSIFYTILIVIYIVPVIRGIKCYKRILEPASAPAQQKFFS